MSYRWTLRLSCIVLRTRLEDGTRRVVDVDCDEDDEEESESDDGRFTGGRATLREDEVVEEVVGTDSTVVDVGKLLPFSELAESMPMCSYMSDSEMDGQSRFVSLLRLHIWR